MYTALAPLIAGLLSIPFHFQSIGFFPVGIGLAVWGGGIRMLGWVLAGFGAPEDPESDGGSGSRSRSRHD